MRRNKLPSHWAGHGGAREAGGLCLAWRLTPGPILPHSLAMPRWMWAGGGRDCEGIGLDEEARGRGGGGAVAWAGGEASKTGWPGRARRTAGKCGLSQNKQADKVFFQNPCDHAGGWASLGSRRCPRRPSAGKRAKMLAWRRLHARTPAGNARSSSNPSGRWARGC